MSTDPAAQKPEPIRVGVSGFSAFDPAPVKEAAIDWGRIIGLPPFQMFAAERLGMTSTPPDGTLIAMVREADRASLYAEYAQWHAKKGCWPKEDPLGYPKEN
jgi:hypothetical protein